MDWNGYRESLAKKIRDLLDLTDDEREVRYGTTAWKLIIRRYVDLVEDESKVKHV